MHQRIAVAVVRRVAPPEVAVHARPGETAEPVHCRLQPSRSMPSLPASSASVLP